MCSYRLTEPQESGEPMHTPAQIRYRAKWWLVFREQMLAFKFREIGESYYLNIAQASLRLATAKSTGFKLRVLCSSKSPSVPAFSGVMSPLSTNWITSLRVTAYSSLLSGDTEIEPTSGSSTSTRHHHRYNSPRKRTNSSQHRFCQRLYPSAGRPC